MICKTYDYAASNEEMIKQINAELAEKTPEEAAIDRAREEMIWQKTKASYQLLRRSVRKVANPDTLKEFLRAAERLRELTEDQGGWICISVDQDWNGQIDMRFDQIFFMDHVYSHTHDTFAMVFQTFRDVTISVHEGKVRVQIFHDIYDLVSVPQEKDENS